MIGFKLAFSHFTFPSARSHFLFLVLVTSVFKTTSQKPDDLATIIYGLIFREVCLSL